jgi:hypothetical protein
LGSIEERQLQLIKEKKRENNLNREKSDDVGEENICVA